MKKGWWLLIAVFLLLIDAGGKWWIHNYIPLMSFLTPNYPFGGIGIFQNLGGVSFSIIHVENMGAAWGAFSAFSTYLVILRICIVLFLIGYLFLRNKESKRFAPILLIITGALGNILDSFIYGHVVDMFYFIFWGYSYPVFNLADSLIVLGVLWLFLLSCSKKKSEKNHDD